MPDLVPVTEEDRRKDAEEVRRRFTEECLRMIEEAGMYIVCHTEDTYSERNRGPLLCDKTSPGFDTASRRKVESVTAGIHERESKMPPAASQATSRR